MVYRAGLSATSQLTIVQLQDRAPDAKYRQEGSISNVRGDRARQVDATGQSLGEAGGPDKFRIDRVQEATNERNGTETERQRGLGHSRAG